MISISDSDEPIWPRAPPSNARTTSRRSRIERSSNRRLRSCRAASARSIAIRKPPEACRQRVHPFTRAIKLTLLGRLPVGLCAGIDTVCPAFGQELVQEDQAPAQREQRVEQREPGAKAGIAPIDRGCRTGKLP